MAWIILRMLSTKSLAAFTASVIGPRPLSQPQLARAASDPPRAAPAPFEPGLRLAPAPAPGKILPRGSLLDLSV